MIICQLFLLFLAKRVYSYCSTNKECPSGCCFFNACHAIDKCENKEARSLSSGDGDSCFMHSGCLSNCCYHQYCSSASTCDGLLGEDEMCFDNNECYSLTCFIGHCAPDPNSDLLGLYEKCAEHEECISNCCSSKSGKCIDSYECSNNSIGQYCFYDHECASDYCSSYHCEYLPVIDIGAQGFISIGLPILGAIVITVGIILMLKCCKHKLMNGRELDLEKVDLNKPANSNNVSSSSIMAPNTTTPNAIPEAPLKA
jgi:hypothetical protein